jgi:tetratricopeptide (TPR) repeat protein
MTGTFEFRAPDGSSGTVLLLDGRPSKARLSTSSIYLGQVLLEMGAIDAPTLDKSLRELSAQPNHKLHGRILLEHAAITSEQLEQALEKQLLQKLAAVARMPVATVFEFYGEWDGLAGFGGEPTPIDGMTAVWASVREQPPFEHVKAALERMMRGRLRLSRTAQLDRFGLTTDELRWIDLLRIQPMRLDDFFAGATINERIARLLVYCLAITKQVDLISEQEAAAAAAAAAAVPPPEPSSSSKIGPPPSSPRGASKKSVARVTLQRQRVPSMNSAVEELSSSRLPIPDRRASPPPPSPPSAPSAAPPLSPPAARQPPPVPPAPKPAPGDLEGRRKEVLERAAVIDKQNYFDMLGVQVDATPEDVKRAYIQLAKAWHPDRLPSALADVREACGRVFARMSEAHQTLTDEEKRKRYQRLMKEGGETPEQQQEIVNVVSATVEFQKAEICMKKNDLVRAEELARRAVQLDPEQADYIALVAWLEALKPTSQTPEETQKRIGEIDRALKLNERCERAYFYRAMLYKRQHRESLAFKDFKKVAELNPKNIDAQRELRLYEMRGGPPRRITPQPMQAVAPKPGLFQKFFKK